MSLGMVESVYVMSVRELKNKMIKNKLLSVLLVIICSLNWSCEGDSSFILEPNQSKRSISISKSITTIPVDSAGLVIYRSDPAIYQSNGEFLLYAYSNPLHSFDIYNITKKTFQGRIQLNTDGPNQINKVYNTLVLNADSIYIMGKGKLYLINGSGEVLNIHNTMFEASDITEGGYFHSPNEANFLIDRQRNEMLGLFIHNTTIASNRTPEALTNLILGRYNLTNNELSFLPVTYSGFIKHNNGDFREIKPNFTFVQDKLIYNWPIESNIYTYDFITAEKQIFGAKSIYSENFAKIDSDNPNYDYRNEGTWFNSVNPYPGTNYFYRTHWGSQPVKMANGSYTDATTKPGFIMLLSENFEVIKEIELDKQCFLEGSFATNEGIFFWAKDGLNENEMKFCVYTIDK